MKFARLTLLAVAIAAFALLFAQSGPALAVTFTVNSTADAPDASPGNGVCASVEGCTLRAAIEEANALAGADTINFNISPSGFHEILVFDLPAITQQVTIDGTTQPGFAGTPIIELDGGGSVGPAVLAVMEGSGSTIKGLRIVQSPLGDGLRLENPSGGNFVQGNYIGTDGSLDLGNDVNGLYVSSPSNTIGGTSAATRNVISGNGNGVWLGGSGNAVAGNFIGTNAAGTAPISNDGSGIRVIASNNCIGGVFIAAVCTPSAAARNVTSGNFDGIAFQEGGAGGNQVLGNFIGTQVDGVSALANVNGIHLAGFSVGPTSNVVGSATDAAARNVIAFNAFDGVFIENGSIPPMGNAIRGNSIHSNGQLGIDLAGGTETAAGVTQNDAGDGDTGPNTLQNFPALTYASSFGGITGIGFSFNSSASQTFTFDFYRSASCDVSGNGEGQSYIGTATVTTDAGGNATTTSVSFPVMTGEAITATATTSGGNTSEFSNCVRDSDTDGWSDTGEAVIGTNPNLKCGTNAWPADINNDGFSDITDISALTGDFGDAVPSQAPARHNIAPDPPDGFVDITDISRLTGLFGQACSP